MLHLITLGAELRERGVGLRVLEQGLDTAFEYRPCIVLKLAHAFALLPKRQATPQQEDGDGDAERGYRYGEG
ncbi:MULTISPECIES: hypothetical protein [Rhodococcus]|uniref:hypothetical protein n=1 Tax=Rhodococcus TaxID=1827 RepID=UPI001E475984|nr:MULTISPECIES: hypothetical protein [Rhodococcus]